VFAFQFITETFLAKCVDGLMLHYVAHTPTDFYMLTRYMLLIILYLLKFELV
jgi:hypothetical protein